MKQKSIAVIIQARCASERVPNKMLRPFAGSTLLDLAIERVLKAGIDEKDFFVSTADDEIAEVASRHNVNVFWRSRASAAEPVALSTALEWHDKLMHDSFVIVNACNPLLRSLTIADFIKHFAETKSRGMFAVVKHRSFFYDHEWNMLNGFTGSREYLTTLETKMVTPIFEAAHSLYAGTMTDISKNVYMGTFICKNDPEMFVLPDDEFIDIDWPYQFTAAEAIYSARCIIENQ